MLQMSMLLVVAISADQFPSPMVEHTRAHRRLVPSEPAGKRAKLSVGTLFLPAMRLRRIVQEKDAPVPLLIHFHGAGWLAETAAAQHELAALAVHLGTGSSVYAKPFLAPGSFRRLLDEAAAKAGVRWKPIVLSGWSAGYGAIRQILRDRSAWDRIDAVLLLDGMHAGYVEGTPGPKESRLVDADLEVFVDFARAAMRERKRFVITHSEVFPGTFASTTETADYLIAKLGLRRTAVLKWGPLGMQQLSEVAAGKLLIMGYAGNSAPDHVDHLHALPEQLPHCGFGR